MIAFPAFVVVAKDTFAIHDKRQPVLEVVGATGNRRRQKPKGNLDKRLIGEVGPGFSISLAFMLLLVTTPWSVVNKNNGKP
jgi:hypothetical protein